MNLNVCDLFFSKYDIIIVMRYTVVLIFGAMCFVLMVCDMFILIDDISVIIAYCTMKIKLMI